MKRNVVRIDYESPITLENALRVVRGVVQGGKISEDTRGIKHYCWASRYNTREIVAVRRKRNKDSADSFYVYQDSNKNS